MMEFELGRSRFFATALIAVAGVLAASWFALNRFDETLAKARAYVAADPLLAAKAGTVDSTTLYKLRYLDQATTPGRCFAEYSLLVSGGKGGSVAVRVRACGNRAAPQFSWEER
jgi:hypothetical protein